MPIYEYACKACENCFERLVMKSDSDKAEDISCPKCGSKDVKRLMSCSSFIGSSGLGSCQSGNSGFS